MFVIEVPYINLNQIYDSYQSFRWIKLKDNKYVIPFRDKALKIEQQKDRLIMSCSEDDFYNTWFKYFDLQTDYMDLNYKIKYLGGKFKKIAVRASGMHVLNQDPFEVYIQTKIMTNMGFFPAFSIVNHIAEVCGIKHVQSMREAGKVTWYEFPTPEMILQNFDKLDVGRTGSKALAWLKKLCLAIVNDGFDITKSDNELFRLFAMGDKSVFPVNGIEDTLAKNFDCDIEDFADWYLDEIENKGLVYLYIYYHISNPPKKEVRAKWAW